MDINPIILYHFYIENHETCLRKMKTLIREDIFCLYGLGTQHSEDVFSPQIDL